MTLKEYLIEHGMTVKEFARRAGVSYNTTKKVKNGMRLKLYEVAKKMNLASNGEVGISDLCEEGVVVEDENQ